MERLVSTHQVAEMTTLPVGTLGWLRHQGHGPRFYKLGRRVVYKQSDVEAWLEERLAEGTKGSAT